MKIILPYIAFILFCLQAKAQVEISGRVCNHRGEVLTGVNVYLTGTYDGATTDADGHFTFTTSEKGSFILNASFIGFKTYSSEIEIAGEIIRLDIVLKESSNSLDAVIITAGTFEASDEKKAVTFKPLDIVTTGGALADIPSAINTLPGTQTVGEEGKLFVRGGDSYETQTFVDGMIVDKPYSSTAPDIPARGMFSPFMFKGTIFSSGGYSAEYGQALSSALILQTNDMPSESVSSLSFMSIGAGASHTKKWKKNALSLSADYMNLGPYFALLKQNFDWKESPQGFAGSTSFRQKIRKDGMLKVYGQLNSNKSSLNYPGYLDIDKTNLVKLNDDNVYLNTTYRDNFGEKWISQAGLSYSLNNNKFDVAGDHINDKLNNKQFKYNLMYLASEELKVKFGGDIWSRNYSQSFDNELLSKPLFTSFTDNISSVFAEAEVRISKKFAARAGGRFENSDLINRTSLAPRMSLAYKTGKSSQVSFAFGTFYQSPQKEYLLFTNKLDFEKAQHYILNFQYVKNNRTFRVEAYYKDYTQLVKYDTLHATNIENYNSNGKGFARGIDVFWRDKTRGNIDYWISYSYIDTKREYKDYPVAATPYFVSNHNLSLVYKQYIPKIASQLGFTYKFASGRPYYNPENPEFMTDRTKTYNDLSFNISYLTHLWDNFTIVYFSLSNLLGWEQSFGYRYSQNPDDNGNYPSYEIKPGARRFIFLGVFVSI